MNPPTTAQIARLKQGLTQAAGVMVELFCPVGLLQDIAERAASAAVDIAVDAIANAYNHPAVKAITGVTKS
jgi:hypothetical protein